MNSKNIKKAIAGIILIIISFGTSLLIIEVLIRIILPDFRYDPKKFKYEIWPAQYEVTLYPDSSIMTGISGPAYIRTNAQGLRGDDFPNHETFTILALGGSTTECLYLDQTETWPQILQQRLNESLSNTTFWVGNGGKSATSTRHHILQLRYALEQYPKVDLILILMGVNDFAKRLARGRSYEAEKYFGPKEEGRYFSKAFKRHPRLKYPFYNKLALWRVLSKGKKLFDLYFSDTRQDPEGKAYSRWRKNRQLSPPKLQKLPDLRGALKEYETNIGTLIQLANQQKIQLIFVTQPSMWRKNLTPYLDSLLWLGGIGHYQNAPGADYYSVESLAKGMALYNQVLLNTCVQHRIQCFDLAPTIPKDTGTFYDDVHFNEQGALKVAGELNKYLLNIIPKM